MPHFGTLHVNWLWNAIVLIVSRQIYLNTISCLDINLEYLFSFKFRWSRRLNERSLFWSLAHKIIIILTRLGSHGAIISVSICSVLSIETSQAASHSHSCLVNSHGLLSVQMVKIGLLGCCSGLMVLVLLSGWVEGGRWRRRSGLGTGLLVWGQEAGSRSGIRVIVDVAILNLIVDLHLNSSEHGRIYKATWEICSVRHATYAEIA